MDNISTGIILIDAPTWTGKTYYIRKLGATPANTLSSEQLVDVLLQMARDDMSLEETAAKLNLIQYIENMESLAGKEVTQKLSAHLVRLLAKDRTVILTGIDFRQNLPFFLQSLGEYKHFLYTQNVGHSRPVDISPSIDA